MKRCNRCDVLKSPEDFYKGRRICKECRCKQMAQYDKGTVKPKREKARLTRAEQGQEAERLARGEG